MEDFKVIALLRFLGLLTFLGSAGRADPPVRWKAHPDPDIAGYIVRYGTEPATYAWATNVGKVTEAFLSGMVPGGKYFVVVSAYNNTALESPPSGEFNVTMPLPPAQIGLSGLWSFAEGSGGRAEDASIHKNHAQLLGPKWTNSPPLGTAIRFDGTDDYVKVPGHNTLDLGATNYTITLWVQTTRQTAQMLVEKAGPEKAGMVLLALNRLDRSGASAYRGAFSIFDGRDDWVDSVGRNLTDGGWHHVAVSYDSGEFKLYLDGRLDSHSKRKPGYRSNSGDLIFGVWRSGRGAWPFQGCLGEARLYQRVLTAAEIAELFDSKRRRPEPELR